MLGGRAGRLDQRRAFDEAPKVLLVQMSAGNRLNRALQLGQRERLVHQFEYHGPIFELRPEARDRGGEDAPVVEAHRYTRAARGLAVQDRPPVAPGLDHQTGVVEELVAVERAFL